MRFVEMDNVEDDLLFAFAVHFKFKTQVVIIIFSARSCFTPVLIVLDGIIKSKHIVVCKWMGWPVAGDGERGKRARLKVLQS